MHLIDTIAFLILISTHALDIKALIYTHICPCTRYHSFNLHTSLPSTHNLIIRFLLKSRIRFYTNTSSDSKDIMQKTTHYTEN